MRATGADIPPELFEHLLWHIELQNDPLIPRRSAELATAVAVSKRTLGTCALVCRYFARMCRPRLFHGILLKHHTDLLGCVTLLDASRPTLTSISVYIRKVMVEPSANNRPWLHLLKTDLLHRLSRSVIIHLLIRDPFFYAGLSPRTLQQGLPHSIPRSLSSLSSLTLSSLHFENGRECIRLIIELPMITSLRLENVTWDIPPELSTFRRVHKSIDYIRVLEASARLYPWFLVALIVHQWLPARPSRPPPSDALRWDPNEHDVVMNLCRLFGSHPSPSTPCYWTCYRARHLDIDEFEGIPDICGYLFPL